MRQKLIILLIGIMCIVQYGVAQQGPQFTQFMFNKLAINPAYAGADEAPSITAITRSQWVSVENGPATHSLIGHGLVLDRIGVGASLVHDRVGVHRHTNALTTLAYHMQAGKRSFASFGLQGGITSFRSNYPTLNVTGMDPKLATYVRGANVTLGAGAYFRSTKFDAGLSLPALLSRKYNFNDTLTTRFKTADVLLFSVYRAKLNDRFNLEPAILLKYFPGLPISYDVNVCVVYRNVITGGVAYRANESIGALLKLQLTYHFQMAYAHDFTMKNAALFGGSSHELVAQYVFRKKKRNVASPR